VVKKIRYKIIWSQRSLYQLNEIYSYIHKESPQGAKKVVASISKLVGTLSTRAMIYEADRFKVNNDGSYRAFTVYSYRVAYRIKQDRVIILKVLHTSQEPEIY
jgi:plasmid stabilization system protein ParE